MIKNKGLGRVGLVLSGGGTHGYAHIGVIKVLAKNKIVPEYVVGSSAGALVGVLFCAGKTPKEIEKLFLEKKPYTFLDPTFSKAGLIRGEKITQIVLDYAKIKIFDDLKIPLITNAINVNTGEERVFNKGLLSTAINASIAFPGIFVPRKIGDEYYVDGGVYNPVPVHLAPEADTIIVVDVSKMLNQISSANSAIQVLEQSVLLMQRRLVKYDLNLVSEGKNIVLIKPKTERRQFFDLKSDSLRKMMNSGEKEAKKVLKPILDKLNK